MNPTRLATLFATALLLAMMAQSAAAQSVPCQYGGIYDTAYQFVFFNLMGNYPTCDFMYKSFSPSYFTLLTPSYQPPSGNPGSNELLTNGLFNFTNPYANSNTVNQSTESTVFVQKGYAQDGIYIVDDNVNDHQQNNTPAYSSLDVRVFNVPATEAAGRYGIHVTLDPSNQAIAGKLYGVAVGAHSPDARGIYLLSDGSNSWGIWSAASGAYGIYQQDGDPTTGQIATTGMHFDHFSTSHVLDISQSKNAMTGDFIHANAKADSTGTFTGNFLDFNVTGSQVFKVDASGNVTIPALKANTGTRFVCIDTTGKLVSQTTACSGT